MNNIGFKNSLVFLLFLFLIIAAGACNHGGNKQSNNIKNTGGTLIINNVKPVDSTVMELKIHSNIRQEGYVLIIPTNMNINSKRVVSLKKEFYKQAVFAVHILNPNQRLKKTDVIAIEKAEIICFVGKASKDFYKWVSSIHLKKYLDSAKKHDALIAGPQDVLQKLNLQ